MSSIVQYIKNLWRNFMFLFKKDVKIHVTIYSKEHIDKIQKDIEEYQYLHRFDIQDVEVVSIRFINEEDKTTNNEKAK